MICGAFVTMGGEPPFAALCANDSQADNADFAFGAFQLLRTG